MFELVNNQVSIHPNKLALPKFYSGLKKSSGIYMIINLSTNDIYIGSTINLRYRGILHFSHLSNSKHKNRYLLNAYNKYTHNFKMVMLEYVPDKTNLIDREQYYINLLKPEYNLRKIAHNNLGIKHSEESRKKMSIVQKGKTVSIESRAKMSAWQVGRKLTPEHIENAVKNRRKPVLQFTKDGIFVAEHKSTVVAAEVVNGQSTNIGACCRLNTINKSHKNYIWRYKNV